MSFDAHKNFSYSTIATAPSPATSGTSLVVTGGDGTKFPAVPFNATVWPTGSAPTTANAEIVRVTNISTDTFTITRTQESTSARTIVVGDQIAATVTAKTMTDIETLFPVTEANLSVTDVTTDNVSTSAHGFAPKAPNDSTKFLDGTGAYSVPPTGGFTKSVFSTDFAATGRLAERTVGGGVTSFTANGMEIYTSTTTTSSEQRTLGLNSITPLNAFDDDPVTEFLVSQGTNGQGTTGNALWCIGKGLGNGTGLTYTSAHIGFSNITVASTRTAYATQADGSTESKTSFTDTGWTSGWVRQVADTTSTTSTKFYHRKTLVATISANLPTGTPDFLISTSVDNVSTTQPYAIIFAAATVALKYA